MIGEAFTRAMTVQQRTCMASIRVSRFIPLLWFCGLAITEDASTTPAQPCQIVTLDDGRVLEGRLNADHDHITLVSAKTGKDIGTIAISASAIVSVKEKEKAAIKEKAKDKGEEKEKIAETEPTAAPVSPTPPAEDASDAGLSPAERALKRSEREVISAVDALNRAKQRNADILQIDMDWDRTEAKKVYHDKVAWEAANAKLDGIHKEMIAAANGIPVAQVKYNEALANYKTLGGTRDFTQLLKEPTPPK